MKNRRARRAEMHPKIEWVEGSAYGLCELRRNGRTLATVGERQFAGFYFFTTGGFSSWPTPVATLEEAKSAAERHLMIDAEARQ